MARINERLPACLAAGFVFGPEFKTNIVRGANGTEWRDRNWLYGRWRGVGNYHAFTPEMQAQMDSAFQVAAGMWLPFRIRDESRRDRWYVEDQGLDPMIGTDEPLQVVRTYHWGGFETRRMIQALEEPKFVLKRNGVEVFDYSLDDQLGLVYPDTTWAAGAYTWTGPHDLWMRFNSDWGANAVQAQRVTSGDIELIEDRQYSDGDSSGP